MSIKKIAISCCDIEGHAVLLYAENMPVQSSWFVCSQHFFFAPKGESLIYRAAGPPVQHHSGRRSFSLI